MSLMDPSDHLVIQSIEFLANDTVTIAYIEKDKNQNDAVGLANAITINARSLSKLDVVDDLLSAAEELVEEGLLFIRNPEPVLGRRRSRRSVEVPSE